MQIRLIVVGRLKEKYWQDAINEYRKRLAPWAKVEVFEVAEERLPENPAAAEIETGLRKEGERIDKLLSAGHIVVPLVIEGSQLSSEGLANYIRKQSLEGKSQIAFIIGGSHGLAPEVIRKGNFSLSFSLMTFPHQMMRVVLMEQLYRAFSIIKGGKYHK
ncbi:MAG: 23S rRNA (pseudouridine(1915)-N(3))-methyltransferase RlmH [Firmicutes bacterium HGW-Firmicutes-12]|jgi:23S rRNA (pseudouridine1915-N3)-methyltransferase|nr:MAG: 23S rRNA (pseudouridine(1915)-N(3))-methyltransferase RlmH [Firmicutes bacterium HGW-Firmicutes-12]